MSYSKVYQQKQLIGRGNFGAAILVTHLSENKNYIAKKIALGGMSKRQISSAYQQANLLSRLQHPNIVHYKQSFCQSGQLIIIMQYCQVGDLAYHVKQKKEANQKFSQTEIMNWVVQICMALTYIHNQGILHRDIKTSNVYLTGNNTVKIGDFGISRILKGSEAAMTVVGTPYYMSPQVCQNQPYSYKTDAWSLGCLIYELCTLKHAFQAENLLGLVYKIVRQTAEPIPDFYSEDLKSIVRSLLIKNSSERISVSQLLKEPYVKQFMSGFIKSKGENVTRNITLKRKDSIREVPRNTEVTETPRQRLERKKKEKIWQEQQALMKAVRSSVIDQQVQVISRIRQRKYDMLYSNPQQRARNQVGIQKLLMHPEPYEDESTSDSLAHSYFLPHSYTQPIVHSHKEEQELFSTSEFVYFSCSSQQEFEDTRNRPFSESLDNRPITGSGAYDLSCLSEQEIAEKDQHQLDQVVDLYKLHMDVKTGQFSENGPVDQQDEVSLIKRDCVQRMGKRVFEQMYTFLKDRREEGMDDTQIRRLAVLNWGEEAEDFIELLDQLIFAEIFDYQYSQLVKEVKQYGKTQQEMPAN